MSKENLKIKIHEFITRTLSLSGGGEEANAQEDGEGDESEALHHKRSTSNW
jgi:hypothetical protein